MHGRFNGIALSLFKNGSFINSTFITGSNVGYSANNRFLVGGISQFTGSYLSGSVANVAVYNTSLSTYFIATNYNGLATRFGLTNITTPTIDEDIQAFIQAAGITDPTEVSAITTLVTDLKTYNIWDKMKAIYPMVGGTATSQKYNLKNPNTFIGTFVGGWTHSSTGVTGNGVNAYMDTNFNPNTFSNANFKHMSYYSRNNFNNCQIGIVAGIFDQIFYVAGGYFNILSTSTFSPITTATTKGLVIASRTSAVGGCTTYVNNSNLGNDGLTATGNPNGNLWLNARTDSAGYSNNQCAFASIGDGLTDTEASNLYTAVQAFQTTLGRQV
jgi:hypothetical protein